MALPETKDRIDGGTIKTERLLLRPLEASDSDAVFAVRSDPRVFYWTTPDTREKSDEWLSARLKSAKTIAHAVFLLHPSDQQDQFIGITGAHNLPEIGYTFLPSAWGKGYATEALEAWIRMYWSNYPDGHPILDEEEKLYLKAVTGPGGEASRRVLEKCGFKWHMDKELDEEEKMSKHKGQRIVLEEFQLEKPHP